MLREYWRKPGHQRWLFVSGQYKDEPYSSREPSDGACCCEKKAGVLKPGSIHALRHSFAMHLLDKGTDVTMIMKLPGHNDIKNNASVPACCNQQGTCCRWWVHWMIWIWVSVIVFAKVLGAGNNFLISWKITCFQKSESFEVKTFAYFLSWRNISRHPINPSISRFLGMKVFLFRYYFRYSFFQISAMNGQQVYKDFCDGDPDKPYPVIIFDCHGKVWIQLIKTCSFIHLMSATRH